MPTSKTASPASPAAPAAVEDEDLVLSDAPPVEDEGEESTNEVELKVESSDRPVKKEAIKSEGIFDTDESDDEFKTENEDDEAFLAASNIALDTAALNSDPGVMLVFYQRLFPFKHLFQWLNHSVMPSNDFAHREFAFTLQNQAYLRYQAFDNAEGLRREILRLNPSRFEIGPVYTANPKDRKQLRKSAFKPLTKELVIDIDLTDYDEIRTCCDKANICHKCWQFVTVAIKIIDVALRDDFGFKHILWVYSGRRGAHAWVCDKKARMLDDQKRRAVAAYLEVIKGGSQSGKKVVLHRSLHPHLLRSFNIAKETFPRQILEEQDPWREAKQAERLLSLIPDNTLTDALRKKWESQSNRPSRNKWEDIDAVAKAGSLRIQPNTLIKCKQEIILEYMYPRLDAEVSKHLNHLLKSPFVVHPGTGRVCVPIDSGRPEMFDPLGVPRVGELIGEIDVWEKEKKAEGNEGGSGEGGKRVQDWEKTSLKPYIQYFSAFVGRLLKDEAGEGVSNGNGVKKSEGGGDPMEF